jgi:N-acetylmuramoyl-L-alanine amidase
MLFERSVIVFFFLLLSVPIFQQAFNSMGRSSETIIEEVKQIKQVSQKHIQCLATGIYYEAAGEPLLGQVAVARVIMNRVLHGFASNPCKVVYQSVTTKDENDQMIKRCQFSWVCENKPVPSSSKPRYAKAVEIANQVLVEDKWREVLPNNVLFFHNLSAAPGWVYKRVTVIGNHVFYSKGKEIQVKND